LPVSELDLVEEEGSEAVQRFDAGLEIVLAVVVI
jgi:hypothetical protein